MKPNVHGAEGVVGVESAPPCPWITGHSLFGQLSATVLTPSFHVLLPMTLDYASYWFRGKRNHFLEGHELSEVRDASEPAAGLPCAQGF